MSIFGALMGDLDDDPFMGGHMRRMNTMMNSFFRDPFGEMMARPPSFDLLPYAPPARRDGRGQDLVRFNEFGMGFPMMPMGFSNIGNMFQNMGSNPNCHSFSSSTFMTMTSGPDGRPQIYQASQSVKQGPGGVRETKKTVQDSRTGVKKMAIGHHINERGHIVEREQNIYSGEREEREDFINLSEDEAENFNREWAAKARTRQAGNQLEAKNSRRQEPQLALPPSSSKDAEDDDDEEEDEAVESRTAVAGMKRKVSTESISSDSDIEEPVIKKLMTTKPKTNSRPIASSSKFTSSSSK